MCFLSPTSQGRVSRAGDPLLPGGDSSVGHFWGGAGRTFLCAGDLRAAAEEKLEEDEKGLLEAQAKDGVLDDDNGERRDDGVLFEEEEQSASQEVPSVQVSFDPYPQRIVRESDLSEQKERASSPVAPEMDYNFLLLEEEDVQQDKSLSPSSLARDRDERGQFQFVTLPFPYPYPTLPYPYPTLPYPNPLVGW